jgi:glycosyltransferase involved in cell wall biosynthesis
MTAPISEDNGHPAVADGHLPAREDPRQLDVLLVAEAFGGGVFELVKVVAEGAAAQGHRVAIAYGRRPETPPSPRDLIDSEVELIELPWHDRSAAAILAGTRQLRRLLRERNPDAVHLYSTFAGVIGSAVTPAEIPTIFTPQAYAVTMRNRRRGRRTLYKALERFASKRATVVGACSEDEGRLACELGAETVTVVPNGIPELDTNGVVFRRPDSRPRVIGIGRTVPQRQPEACARILSAVSDIASVAWIGGGGGSLGVPGAESLRRAGIQPSGWLPREEVLDELADASAYLHWTGWDGLPLSVLEAMARDAVVVASDIGPNRELLGGKQVCSSEEEAVALLRRVLTDEELAGEMLANQRRRRAAYSGHRMIQGWLELYRGLGNGSAEPASVSRNGGASMRHPQPDAF